jgi:hypothetical protein
VCLPFLEPAVCTSPVSPPGPPPPQACLAEHTCPDCVLPYEQSVPYATRVHRFLYDIKLTSVCCQVRPPVLLAVASCMLSCVSVYAAFCSSLGSHAFTPASPPLPPFHPHPGNPGVPHLSPRSPSATAARSTPLTSPCCTAW